MILDTVNRTLEFKMAEAVTTTQPSIAVDYADIAATPTFVPGEQVALGNSTSVVTILSAPASSTQRQVKFLNVYNSDTVSHIVTIQYNDNASIRLLYVGTLAVGQTLSWTPNVGWALSTVSSTTTPTDGWTAWTQTWTYASATTFTLSGDYSTLFAKGDKLKLTQTTVKYFYVVAVVFAVATTTVTVTGGSDYSLANALITSPYSSKAATPDGFPQWFNWSPTIVGFSALPSGPNYYRFTMSGRTVSLIIRQVASGTANSATFTLTAPIISATVGANYATYSLNCVCWQGAANAATSLVLPHNSSVIECYLTPTFGAWPASGSRSITGATLVYEA